MRQSGIQIEDLGFDYQALAVEIVSWRRGHEKSIPDVAKLSRAISEVRLSDTIEGSSTLEITVVDQEFELIEFFDVNQKGHLEGVDLNYPPDTNHWWRLSQLSLDSSTEGLSFTLVFIERPVAYLLHHPGPKKARRSKVTRAEFFKSLCDQVQAGGGVRFHSRELHKKQPTTLGGKVDEDDRREKKGQGLHAGADVNVVGIKATRSQIRHAERILDQAVKDHATDRATVAMLCAAIGESTMGANMHAAGSQYVGILQGSTSNGFSNDSDEEEAHYFLKGGKGYQAGGAIAAAKAHPHWSAGTIAYKVEGSRANFGSDAQAEEHYSHDSEAEAFLAEYGWATNSTDFYRQEYHFQIGTEDEPHESYWDGMVRLADEVNWRLFVDGRTVYFDHEMELITQKPIAVVHREGAAVLDYSVTIDVRGIATEMTIDLVCEPFEFRAGQVFRMVDFGPVSRCSAARPKLPGRWLIVSSERSSGSLATTFTLGQPDKPKREPANELSSKTDDNADRGSGLSGIEQGMTPREIIETLVLPVARRHKMVTGRTPKMVETANEGHSTNTTSGNVSDHKGPPSKAWAADMSNGTNPTKQMDALADELASLFGFKVAHDHVYAFPSVTKKGFRFQLGYRTNVGGNHFNHVHFGCKNLNYIPGLTQPAPQTHRPDL